MRMIEEVANMLDKMMLVEFVDDVSRKGVVVVDAVVVADNLMGSRVVAVSYTHLTLPTILLV